MTFRLSDAAPRILLVSDDVAVTDTLSRMLRLDGYEVWAALSPNEGLSLATKHHPHAIILDLRMPLGSALGTIRRLRGVPGLDATPIAIVSGDYHSGEAHSPELEMLGANIRYKPVWLRELVALARDLLRIPVRD